MPTWYPSVVVNLQVRFDETYNVLEDDSPDAQSMTGIEPSAQSFGPAKVRPLVLSGAKDKLTQIAARIPMAGTVELAETRQAQKFSLTFDYRVFPIDPRVVRDCRVEIFIGVTQPGDFARGMVSVQTDQRTGIETRASVIDTSQSQTQRSNNLMIGLVDLFTVDHGENGSTITIEGRDLRGVLLDQKADPRIFSDVDLTQDIQQVVLQVLSKLPYGGQINVVVQEDEWPNGLPRPFDGSKVVRHRRGADGKRKPRTSPPGHGTQQAFWDFIVHLCNDVGAVPFFKGADLCIRPVSSLYQQVAFDGTRPTPFQYGYPRLLKLDKKTEKIRVRRFVFGRDIQHLRTTRKTRGTKVPGIIVTSIDTTSSNPGLQKAVHGSWPANTGGDPKKQKKLAAANKTSVAPSGQVSQQEYLVYRKPGLKSKQACTDLARAIYEEIGRREIEVQVTTSEFASFNTDDGVDPDMLRIVPSDAVQIMVDRRALSSRNPLVSELSDRTRESFGAAVETVTKHIGDENFARVLVATSRNSIIELQDTFMTQNVKYTIGEDGFSIDFDAVNYVEVRSGALNPNPPQPTKKPTKKSSSSGAPVKFNGNWTDFLAGLRSGGGK